MSLDQKTCESCVHALHGRKGSICLHVFDFVSTSSPLCLDYVHAFQPVKYTGECLSHIKDKSYSRMD